MREIIGSAEENSAPVTGVGLVSDLDEPSVTSDEQPGPGRRPVRRPVRAVLAVTFAVGLAVGIVGAVVGEHVAARSRARSAVSLTLLPIKDDYSAIPGWGPKPDKAHGIPARAQITLPIQVVNTGSRALTVASLTGAGSGWTVYAQDGAGIIGARSAVQFTVALTVACDPRAGATISAVIAVRTSDRVARKVVRPLDAGAVIADVTRQICAPGPPSLLTTSPVASLGHFTLDAPGRVALDGG